MLRPKSFAPAGSELLRSTSSPRFGFSRPSRKTLSESNPSPFFSGPFAIIPGICFQKFFSLSTLADLPTRGATSFFKHENGSLLSSSVFFSWGMGWKLPCSPLLFSCSPPECHFFQIMACNPLYPQSRVIASRHFLVQERFSVVSEPVLLLTPPTFESPRIPISLQPRPPSSFPPEPESPRPAKLERSLGSLGAFSPRPPFGSFPCCVSPRYPDPLPAMSA